MKRLLTIITIIALAIILKAESPYITEFDIPYTSKTDPYSQDRLKLDIHHHSSGTDMPVVVWFHGGGLTKGKKHIPAPPYIIITGDADLELSNYMDATKKIYICGA